MAGDMIRIVHAADIHLDSPLRGLGRLGDEDLANRLRSATREAFDRLIEHCLATLPGALVLAGDLYDGDWKDYSTGVHLTSRMRDLHDAGIPVVMVQGNHDAESVISLSLTLPPNVTRLSTARPETARFADIGLAVHGQGFATRAVSTNLALAYPPPDRDLVNVGLLHTSVQGYAAHDPYAPCSLADLTGLGYDYVALGHVHARETLSAGPSAVAFSGNLQGRHPGEPGAKGALDVALRPGGEAEITFLPLDVARWSLLEIDVTGAEDEAAVVARVEAEVGRARESADTRPVVARVRLVGTSHLAGVLADTERVGYEIRPMAARHAVAVDKIRSEVTAPADRRVMPEAQRATLESVLGTALADPALLFADPELAADLAALVSEVNERYTRTVGLDLRDAQQLAELVAEAAQRLGAKADGGLL